MTLITDNYAICHAVHSIDIAEDST